MTQAAVFLFRTLADLYLMVLLIRLFLQLFRGNFRNPIAQAVLKATSPLVIPVRSVVPAIGRIDTATVLVALVFEVAFIAVLVSLPQFALSGAAIVGFAAVRILMVALRLFFVVVLIHVIISWVAPGTYNPVTAFIADLGEPVLRPVRRVVPPLAGLDLSPLVVLIGLQFFLIAIGSNLPGYLH